MLPEEIRGKTAQVSKILTVYLQVSKIVCRLSNLEHLQLSATTTSVEALIVEDTQIRNLHAA